MVFTDCGKFEQVEIPSIYLIQHHTHRIVIFNLVKNNILTTRRFSSKQEKKDSLMFYIIFSKVLEHNEIVEWRTAIQQVQSRL